MEQPHDKRWWDLKTFGFLPPREENRIIVYVLLALIFFTLVYISSFYFR